MGSPTRKEKIEAMLAEEPNDPELHYMLAMEHMSQGDDAGAVQCFERLFGVAPNYPPAYHMAGQALARLGRIDEARSMLQKGIPIALGQNNAHAAGEMQGLLESLD